MLSYLLFYLLLRQFPIKPRVSIALKSFSFYPKSNFPRPKFVSLENKNFCTNNKRKNRSQNLLLEFAKFPKMQLLYGFSKIIKISEIRKSGQNWHFYLSIKPLITHEIVITSLSGTVCKNATAKFQIFSQTCDLL